jgi:cell division protein FtsB
MITRQRRQSLLGRLWMPLITAVFLGYFGFHAFNGYYGIWSRDRLEAEAARLSIDLDQLKQEHAEIEHRVTMLRADNLDADLVDVEARAALNRIRSDEVVINFGRIQQ